MYTLLKKTVSIIVIVSFVLMPVRVYADPAVDALPVLGGIVGGDASGTVSTVGTAMTVNQNVDKMIGNWDSFSIGQNASVQFVQPGTSSIALNRVTGASPSEIFGALTANGRVFLVNPNGVLFSPTSHVDTMGLIASSLNITDDNFLASNYYFTGEGGSVVNQGALNAVGGFVALLGGHVANSGTIVADLGTVALASGSALTVSLDTQSVINVVVNDATTQNEDLDDAAVANLSTGSISANGGKVLLTAKVVEDLFAKAINNEGVVEATKMNDQDGQIVLQANDDIFVSGGSLTATNINANTTAGFVVDGGSVLAQNDSGNAAVNVSANAVSVVNGGEVSASVSGSGDALVTLVALDGDLEIDSSDILAETYDGNATVVLNASGSYGEVYDEASDSFVNALIGGNIYIENGSTVKAVVENQPQPEPSPSPSASPVYDSYSGNGNALVELNYGDVGCVGIGDGSHGAILVDNSDVTAKVDNGGTAYIYMGDGNYYSDVSILDGSNILASIGFNQPYEDTAAINIYGNTITIDDSMVQALSTDPEMTGNASIYMQSYDNGSGNGGQITIDNSTVEANVAGDGDAEVNLYAYDYNYNSTFTVDILGDSSVLASVDRGKAAITIYGEDVKIDGGEGYATVQASTRNAEASGNTASVTIYERPNNNDYYYGNNGSLSVSNANVGADVVGSGNASVLLGYNNWYDSYNTIDILDSSILASVGGSGNATINMNVYEYTYYDYYYGNDTTNHDTYITVDNSDVTAAVAGSGNANIYMRSYLENYWYSSETTQYFGDSSINILNGASVLSTVGNGNAQNYLYVYNYNYDYYGNIVESDSTGDALINIDNASLTADVIGNGSAYNSLNVYVYNDRYNNASENQFYGDASINLQKGALVLARAGSGNAQNYLRPYAQNYEEYNSGNSEEAVHAGDATLNIDNSTVEADVISEGSAYNSLQAEFYSYYYENYYGYSNADNFYGDVSINLRDSQVLASVGSGSAGNYFDAENYNTIYNYKGYPNGYNYDAYPNTYGTNGQASIMLDNSLVSATVAGDGNAYNNLEASSYIDGYELMPYYNGGWYWSSYWNSNDSDNGSLIQLTNSRVSSFVGSGTSEVNMSSQNGSILGDSASLITADWVYLEAQDNIGTLESPINTDTRNLVAYSWGDPVWVPDVVEEAVNPEEITLFSEEQSGHYLYGTGNIYVNNIGTDLLNIGSAEDYDGEAVEANNGVIWVTTKGDMVVHNADAYAGGVFLESQQGSIYAGESRDGENGANVIAGGYSYFSAPNGTIGVGEPGDAYNGISGQIKGLVDPGEVAVTGVDPAPAFDPRYGKPDGFVYYQGEDIVQEVPTPEPSPSPSPDVLESTSQELSVTPAPIQSIWPTPGTISEMNNPLKVNIQLIEGAPSAAPVGFTPTSALTLRLGKLQQGGVDPALLVNPLNKDLRAYYELLSKFQYTSFEPTSPTGFYAYHPLNEADTDAYDGIGLDPAAYEFIDGNLKYNGDEDPFKKRQI